MRYDFKKAFKDLDGSDVVDQKTGKPLMMNELLAYRLRESSDSAHYFRYFNWASALYADGSIEMNEADVKDFKKFIEDIKPPAWVRVPLENVLKQPPEA